MSREAFEAWFSDDGKCPRACERSREGGYVLAHAADAWRAWQAAQADAYERAAKVCETHTVEDMLVGVGIARSCATIIRELAKEAT